MENSNILPPGFVAQILCDCDIPEPDLLYILDIQNGTYIAKWTNPTNEDIHRIRQIDEIGFRVQVQSLFTLQNQPIFLSRFRIPLEENNDQRLNTEI